MKKLASASNKVFVELTNTEFEGLAQVDDVDSVPDGNNVSLAWVQTLIDSVSQFQPYIVAAKAHTDALSAELGNMITP